MKYSNKNIYVTNSKTLQIVFRRMANQTNSLENTSLFYSFENIMDEVSHFLGEIVLPNRYRARIDFIVIRVTQATDRLLYNYLPIFCCFVASFLCNVERNLVTFFLFLLLL